ncbi:hypothetical protein CA51_10190 [Rosistilla oblonga]|nr:hypothetical protein CA51_10190 [Rosistilla oblonga]
MSSPDGTGSVVTAMIGSTVPSRLHQENDRAESDREGGHRKNYSGRAFLPLNRADAGLSLGI